MKYYAILETAIDVTSQELSKSVIEKSGTDLRNLIMQAPVAMGLLMGRDYILHIGNEKIFELWGREGSLIINQPIFSALPEAIGQGLEDLLENVFNTSIAFKGYEVPTSLPRSNGVEIVFINFAYEAFRNVEGEITGIMLVGTDVTEQVNARQLVEKSKIELQLTTNRLQLAIEAGELGLFELNLLDEGLISSDRFKEIFEISANAKFYDTLVLVHPDDLHTREEAHRLSKETGILDYTAKLQFPGNRTKWVMIKGLLTFDENHTAQTILGIVQDISESKELLSTKTR